MNRRLGVPFFLLSRNLRSGNKWTLSLTIFMMAVAFINLIFIASLFNGIITGANRQIVDTTTSDLFLTPNTGSDTFTDVPSLLTAVRATSGVRNAAAEMVVPGNLQFQNVKGSWSIFAITPSEMAGSINLSTTVASGTYLADDDADGILLGRQVAGGDGVELNTFSLKGAKVGDQVTLTSGAMSKVLTVRGIINSHFINADQRAFISYAALQSFMPKLASQATMILTRTATGSDVSAVQAHLVGANLNVQVHPWNDAAGLMKTVTDSFVSVNVLLSFVAVLIAAVTIFIVVYIDIVNRRQQIGILRAIGVSPFIIRSQYVLQTILYAVSGVIVGLALFYAAIVPYFQAHPFTLPIGQITLAPDAADFSARIVSIIIVAIVAGLIPVTFITRMKLLKAI